MFRDGTPPTEIFPRMFISGDVAEPLVFKALFNVLQLTYFQFGFLILFCENIFKLHFVMIFRNHESDYFQKSMLSHVRNLEESYFPGFYFFRMAEVQCARRPEARRHPWPPSALRELTLGLAPQDMLSGRPRGRSMVQNHKKKYARIWGRAILFSPFYFLHFLQFERSISTN